MTIVNNFSINVATTNGTGSQTANLAILRALFKMGIPVNGKNIFPSNIQGLPTWYQIRLSAEGYVARRSVAEILVAFNETTVHQDVQAVPAGGVCLYNDDWRYKPDRSDLALYGLPVNLLLRQAEVKGRMRDYMGNMVYVGALGQLLGISLEHVQEALSFYFKGKQPLVESNMGVVRLAYQWMAENVTKVDPYCVEAMNENAGKILITGNEAAALGSVFGGVTVVAWYPITPSTSLVDALNEYLPQLRHDPETGANNYLVIQAEDELAAIGMVVGAGWAGARAMTATSGPGISLMAEFAGLAYFAEVPALIWDIQRVGPSTGLPTRTSQGDVLAAYYLGHGDTQHIVLFPATVGECFQFGTTGFNLADELQTLVFVLSDLDLGMNNWMSEPFAYPTEPIKRGKLLTAEQITPSYGRYKDVDGDGIPYRTIPGNEHPLAAWLGRGTGHNEQAAYSERPEDWQGNMQRLAKKFETARQKLPAPILDEVRGARTAFLGYGTTVYAIEEARDLLAKQGFQTSFLRLRALPISPVVRDFVAKYDHVFVIELNRDGQLHQILQTELPDLAPRLISWAHLDGLPLTAEWIVAKSRAISME